MSVDRRIRRVVRVPGGWEPRDRGHPHAVRAVGRQSCASVGASLMGEAIPRCHCTLPLTVPPAHVRIWDTGRDPDPGPWVSDVVRWGDEPRMRRWVRRAGTGMRLLRVRPCLKRRVCVSGKTFLEVVCVSRIPCA
jgi:hypothetical protein